MLVSQEEFDKLVIDNKRFAYKLVKDEFSKYPWDIRQELNSAAIAGLVYAATKYDPTTAKARGNKFISYAVHWIRYYVNEEVRKLYPVKFNQNFIIKRNKVMRCINDYKKKHNDEMPTVDYISGCINMSKKVVQNILDVNGGENFTFMSLNSPTETKDAESEDLTESKIVNEYYDNAVDESFENNMLVKDVLENLQKEIPEVEYNIFYDHYFKGENFTDLAKKYNMKFPSSVAYLIKKCEKKCQEIANS